MGVLIFSYLVNVNKLRKHRLTHLTYNIFLVISLNVPRARLCKKNSEGYHWHISFFWYYNCDLESDSVSRCEQIIGQFSYFLGSVTEMWSKMYILHFKNLKIQIFIWKMIYRSTLYTKMQYKPIYIQKSLIWPSIGHRICAKPQLLKSTGTKVFGRVLVTHVSATDATYTLWTCHA